jgi:membrane-bound lytic murein transglycosylase B
VRFSPPFRIREEADGPTGKALTASAQVSLCALLVVGGAAAAPPGVNAPIPTEPALLARTLAQTTADLEQAIGDWNPKSTAAPQPVVLHALYQQRIYRLLTRDSSLAARTLAQAPRDLRTISRDLLAAQRELYRLTPPIGVHTIKVARARPAPELLSYYREAQRRFKIPWNVLAAVNFVETKFGKLRSASAAGAQGPMQFMPATWRRYGLGGNVQDAHDAILGAANYLRASGAPHDLRTALHHYNPSNAYVDAVVRYARRIGADRTMFYALYNWQVFVKTPRGDRRVTGPGLP